MSRQEGGETVRVLLDFDSGEEYVRWVQDLQEAALLRRWIEGERLRTRDPVGREEDFE